jgi:hypothetical protein
MDFCGPTAAPDRPWGGVDLSPHVLTNRRLSLPPPPNLLRLRRSGAREIRSMGRYLDDASATRTMSPMGNIGVGFHAGGAAGHCPVVGAMAVRAMAGDQRGRGAGNHPPGRLNGYSGHRSRERPPKAREMPVMRSGGYFLRSLPRRRYDAGDHPLRRCRAAARSSVALMRVCQPGPPARK